MSLNLSSIVPQFNIKMANLRHKAIYEFENFRLDAAHLMLYQSEQEISLAPKVIETLLALVERHGEVLGKDELMELVWTNSIVEEGNLSQNLYLLRKTLGVGKNGKPLIETLRGRGYRFVAEVRRIEEEAKPTYKESAIHSEAKQTPIQKFPRLVEQSETRTSGAVVALADRRHETAKNQPEESNGQPAKLKLAPANPVIKTKPKYHAFALASLLVGAIGLGYYFFSARKTASDADGKKSIAVLPLKSINTANRDEMYEIGIADSLIYRLSLMKGFTVRPLSATRKYADIEQDAMTAGREQQVDYVLASNYQLANGKIKITAQLFNVASGQIEETYKSEKDAGDVFAMQDAIAGEVGNKLSARFAGTLSSPTAKRGTTNEEAYRLYLQGMYLYDKRNSEDARKSVELLDQAVRLDPNYALAWAGKAHAHRYASNVGRDTDTHEEYQKSIEAINKALALDENLSEAYSALCENKYFYEYDFAGAERECKRAVELDPNSSMAHEIYSRYLMFRGRHDEAISEIKTAIALEPTSFFNQRNYGFIFLFARRYEEAVAQFKRVIAMEKNAGNTYDRLITTLALLGNESEAFEWFMKAPGMQNADEETVQAFKTAYQTSGWQGVLRERVKRFEEGSQSYYYGAGLNAQVGEKDKAFEYLEKAYQQRKLGLAYLQVDPRLDALRDDPRFDELVRRVGLK